MRRARSNESTRSRSARPGEPKRSRRARFKRFSLGMVVAGVLAIVGAVIFCATYEFDAARFDPLRGGPLVIKDRHGRTLRSVPSRDGRPGRAHWVPLADVHSHAVLTLLASEDKRFYDHDGVDPLGVARALWLNLTTSGTFGGSTITQQLARMVYSPGKARTLYNKLLETRAALGIERELTKAQILEQYLNRAYYGRGAYGISAAAQRYFGKPVSALSVGEATFLAVMPRGPSYYDPIKHLDRALERRAHLFELLVDQARITPEEAARAEAQRIAPVLTPADFAAPHFVEWVLSELPDHVLERGGVVTTTVDADLQGALENATAQHVAALEDTGVDNAGVVVLDAETAEIRAMVGSSGYDGPAGAINITTWRRHPGSALKPFVYATAIDRDADGTRVAFDVRDISRSYRAPDAIERGPALYREALGGSYNFAAVHVIERTGVDHVASSLRAAGVSPLRLANHDYGSRLAVGATTVRLLDLAAGYRFTVRGGRTLPASGVHSVHFADGTSWHAPVRAETRVFSPEASWIVMDMLSDRDARRKTFGYDLPVDLPYPVVAKTGTAQGFSDTVAVLATHGTIVGAWAGRFDGAAIRGGGGMSMAAPLARAALLLATDGDYETLPSRPVGIVTQSVCASSGEQPGPNCPHRRTEFFVDGKTPTATCDWHLADGTIKYPAEFEGWLRRARSSVRQN